MLTVKMYKFRLNYNEDADLEVDDTAESVEIVQCNNFQDYSKEQGYIFIDGDGKKVVTANPYFPLNQDDELVGKVYVTDENNNTVFTGIY